MTTDAERFEAEALSIWHGDLHDQYDVLSDANILALTVYNAYSVIRVNGGDQMGTIYQFPDGSLRFVGDNGGEIQEWEL